ncbi:MAG: serine/threonine protein kinase, partial [Planctomycetia bacterium]|nr:serine/threonine protein kinase [Planctomycetia bacterium]
MPSDERPAAERSAADQATPPHARGGPDTVPSSGLLSRRSTGFGFADDDGHAGPDPLLDAELGDVRIVRFVAQGGMGRVYEARQRHPDRTVAVKVMRPGSRSPASQQRFWREAEVLGRLRHPGIAQIFTAGCHQRAGEETPYFVMEFVPGAETLGSYCQRRQLPARQRLELLLAACEALAHGHAQGVVHRDLKPGNILVDADGRLKVIDFGIARLVDDAQPDAGSCTTAGQFVGTRQYMSPEQYGTGRIDARADVYALGVIIHEMLTGRLPYDVAGKSLTETIRIVHEEPPARLMIADGSLGGGADAIATRCLAKRPDDRYSSAA